MLFRLYRTVRSCGRAGQPHRKKTELARALLDVLARWVGARRVEISADSACCNDTVTRGLPDTFVLFGAMRPDAVLTAPPPARSRRPGRPPRRGRPVAKPEAIAKDGRRPWLSCEATLYGARRIVRYKTIDAQWYRACGIRVMRIVLVKVDDGAIGMRVFFCTDATVAVPVVLETYAGHWGIEEFFKALKTGCANEKRQLETFRALANALAVFSVVA